MAARHKKKKKRLVLEEIQMPPCLFNTVMDRAACPAAARTGKPRAPGEINPQIKLLFINVQRAALDNKGRRKAQGRLEKINVTHDS